MIRLTKIDDLTVWDHTHLDSEDECYYLGEYTARQGFNFSDTNNLIINLKKPASRKGLAEWRYKEQAIQTAGVRLRAALRRTDLESATFVPIPPSKTKTDQFYDDRVVRIMQVMGLGMEVDIREMILQRNSTSAAHEVNEPRSVARLVENYRIDENTCEPVPTRIVLVDDILTTGAHFKAAKEVLLSYFGQTPIAGLFVARRAPETTDV